jgi:hypothetical protein
MTVFIQDLWYDLREKRMWPFAVLLVIALVAVLVLLPRPAPEQASEGTSTPVTQRTPTAPAIQVSHAKSLENSDLGLFDPKNPFKPRVRLDTGASSSAPPAATAPASGGGSEAGGSAGGEESAPGGSGGSGGSGGGPTTAPPKTTTTQFTYVVDVTFVHNGRKRDINGLNRLEMLPNERSPLLIFLGVGPRAENAVFLVDSTLKANGEGHCKPSASECAFLYLGAGSEHEFIGEDGDSYTLRLDQIRKVKASDAARSRERRARKAHTARARRAFTAPSLADLIAVASTEPGSSSRRKPRR